MPKLSALTALTGANLATLDLFPVVDVSDSTMDAAGTDKKMTAANLAAGLNALALLTINAATQIVGPGTVPAARLGTGTANAGVFLNGAGAWAVPAGAGDVLKAGVSGGLTLRGGTAPTDRLILCATANGAPTGGGTGGGVGICGNLTETLRVRATDGHIVMGDDPNYLVAGNAMVTIRTGTPDPNGLVSAGTGLLVMTSDTATVPGGPPGTPAGGGSGAIFLHNVTPGNGGTNGSNAYVFKNSMNDTAFNGVNAAVYSFMMFAYVDTPAANGKYNLFCGNHVARIVPGIGNKILNPTVASPPNINAVEIDARDDSAGCADDPNYFNSGYLFRLSNSGKADLGAAVVIASGQPSVTFGLAPQTGTFKNGILIATNAKQYALWASGQNVTVGDVRKVGTTCYQVIVDHQTGGAHPTPPGNVTDWRVLAGGARNTGPTQNAIWFGEITGGSIPSTTVSPYYKLDAVGNTLQAGTLQFLTATGPKIIAGTGSPEGAISAPVGSLYLRTTDDTNPNLYIKQSGTGSTGWKSVTGV